MAASFVLDSDASSTYPKGTPPARPSSAAALDDHFEHPAALLRRSQAWVESPRKIGDPSRQPSIMGIVNEVIA
jgi:hypothetical protein